MKEQKIQDKISEQLIRKYVEGMWKLRDQANSRKNQKDRVLPIDDFGEL